MRSCPALLHPIVIVSPFTKWGIDFMDWNPASARWHHHIIMAVDYFTKWVEAIPTIKSKSETTVHFVFNHIITRVGIPREIVTDHGRTFRTK